MNSNKVAWNPREPFNFVLANEDYNLYSFDMRNLDKALLIHKVLVLLLFLVQWCVHVEARERVSKFIATFIQ